MSYITKDEVGQIRTSLKNKFPEFKFSVNGSASGSSVDVSIIQGKVNLDRFIPGQSIYDRPETITQEMHRTNAQHDYLDLCPLFQKIIDTIKYGSDCAHYDNSDSAYDHFDNAFYWSLSIGKSNQPYKEAKIK